MKMKKSIFAIVIVSAIWLFSCQKDLDVFVPDSPAPQGPDTIWHNILGADLPVKLLKKQLAPVVKLDSFEVGNLPNIINTSGMQLRFPVNCLVTQNGQPVTGKVFLETLLITKKGNMILADKPTISNGRVLISGGELFVRVRKENEELVLAPGRFLEFTVPDPAPSPQMRLFYGDESNPDRFNWLPAQDSGQIAGVFAGSQGYNGLSANLRWINCDYFYDTTGLNRISVAASLPPQYTNGNSLCYLVFNNQRVVLPMYGDAAVRKFVSTRIPVGLSVTLVLISKQGDEYFHGQVTATTGATGAGIIQQLVNMAPTKKSLDDIKQIVGSL